MKRFEMGLLALAILASSVGYANAAGWYLMAPPFYSQTLVEHNPSYTAADCGTDCQIFAAAPLDKWHMLDSFDTASQCNAFRDEAHAKFDYGFMQAFVGASRCIPTDDPRLAR